MSQRATGRRDGRLRAGLLAVLLLLGALAAACSEDDPEPEAESGLEPTTTTTTDETSSAAAAETSRLVATSKGQVEVWSSPDSADATSQMLSASTEFNGTLTFLVLSQVGDDWLEVQLPTPPAGSTGFVRAADVELSRHRYRIEISLSAHTIKVFVGNAEVIQGSVALGPDTPPPGTMTFVKDLVIPSSTQSPYGGHVYELAGWSATESQINTGPGVVAIHVASPEQLGQDATTGAIGADQQTITAMVDTIGLPLGTPVVVSN
jgi:hypothetical protein